MRAAARPARPREPPTLTMLEPAVVGVVPVPVVPPVVLPLAVPVPVVPPVLPVVVLPLPEVVPVVEPPVVPVLGATLAVCPEASCLKAARDREALAAVLDPC